MKINDQPSTSIYVGANGHIVIKQAVDFEHDEVLVFITPANAQKVADAIVSLIDHAKELEAIAESKEVGEK